MAIKFKQILGQVLKYAQIQLLNASYAKIKTFDGLYRDDSDPYAKIRTRYYARAHTYSTKVWDKRLQMWVTKRKYEVYDTFIMLTVPKGRQATVVLSCSCPDFLYRHEVALTKKGGAEVNYSNGNLPKIRNPRMRYTCCKHCLRFYQFLSTTYPDLFVPFPELVSNIGEQK